MTKMRKGKWIWFEDALGIQPEQGWFLRDIWLDAPPSRCVIQVCADSRYNLYINGRIVLRGPCRSRARFRCFDEIDIAAHLCRGQNRLFAEILHYSGDIKSSNQFVAGPASVESTMRGGFILHEVETDLGIKDGCFLAVCVQCRLSVFAMGRVYALYGKAGFSAAAGNPPVCRGRGRLESRLRDIRWRAVCRRRLVGALGSAAKAHSLSV